MLDRSIKKLTGWWICCIIDLFFMTETWYDIGFFALDRLRAAVFTVIDCPRPRNPNSMSRTAIAPLFFREFDNLLSCVSALKELLIVGDFNMSLDRPNESHTITFTRSFTWLRTPCPSTDSHSWRHSRRRRIAQFILCRRAQHHAFSDHHLIWSSSFKSPSPDCKTRIIRQWSCLNIPLLLNIIWIDIFCRRWQCRCWCLCFPAPWCNPQGHWSANSTEICTRLRISDPWFDRECRDAKQVVRRLEKAALKTNSIMGGSKAPCSFNRCQWFFATFHFKNWKSLNCIVLCSNFIGSSHLAVCDIRCVPEHKCGRSDETDSNSSKKTVLAWPHANLATQENVLSHSIYSRENLQEVNPPR